jgi:hypothetical protein
MSHNFTNSPRKGSITRRGDFLWKPDMLWPKVRDRSNFEPRCKKLELVAPEEITEALRLVIERGYTISEDAAFSEAASLLGFQRMTNQAWALLAEALELLLRRVMEGAKRRDEEPAIGARRRAQQPTPRAIESLWEPWRPATWGVAADTGRLAAPEAVASCERMSGSGWPKCIASIATLLKEGMAERRGDMLSSTTAA